MKNYTLEAIIKGKTIKFDKKFNSRNSALNFIFDYLDKHYLYNTEIIDEFLINDQKHNVEYVCNDSNRIRICRS